MNLHKAPYFPLFQNAVLLGKPLHFPLALLHTLPEKSATFYLSKKT